LALGFCDVSRERRKIRQVGGGAMRISSRLGKGTTVVVRLPIDAVTPQRVDIKNVAA
jgi:chemotaxis protein histidine kinase CheA